MRIRAIDVRNWGCIDAFTITGLADGVVLLHGPNRIGKSTLVQAIRSGIFDHAHDSTEGIIHAAIPWRTKNAPSVVIEFEHEGNRYKISKTFAKSRGGATLEQDTPVGWFTLERGKEATRRVRDLLGAESSAAGVYQMLWLGQRDFLLPAPRDLDPSLAKALEAVLGTLITGRDIDFKQRLDKACERWFTEKTMRERAGSPTTRMAAELEEADENQAEHDRNHSILEAALKQYEEAIARQPELKRCLEAADVELARITNERQAFTVRKSQHDIAVRHRDAERRHVRQVEAELAALDQAEGRRASAEQELRAANLHLLSADERLRFVQAAADQARLAFEQAERERSLHQQSRGPLDDRRQLAHLATQGQSLDQTIEQVQDWLKLISDLDSQTQGRAAVSAQEIERLRQLRDQAAKLRAQLEASEIQIVIKAKKPFEGTMAVDGAAASEVLLFAGTEQEFRARRHAELALGKLASVQIRRAKEDGDQAELARRLAELERKYRDGLTALQADPEQADALDVLTTRRLEHESGVKELQRARLTLARSAPAGLPALQAQRQRLRAQEEALLARHPELRGWTPSQADVDQLRGEFEERERHLHENVESVRTRLALAEQALGAEVASRQGIRDRVGKLTADLAAAGDLLAQRDRASLVAAVAEAQARLAEAEAKVQCTMLSDEEQAIETRYQTAVRTRNQCDQRVRADEILLEGLRVKLSGTEGLHQMRIQAEQRVNDLTRELERETLFANAHKHLKELFEEVRSEQVGRTVGPINDRVMAWSKQIGLTDYSGLAFGEQLLPGGLVPLHAVNGDAIDIDTESYGTMEQLSLLVRLAVGGLLARTEPTVALLDDPLAHSDPGKHRKMLDILAQAAQGDAAGPSPTGPLQLIVLTCHPERFTELAAAQVFDLTRLIRRG